MADKPGKTIRAFVALDLDPTSLRRVARVADRLRIGSGAPSATWVAPAQMHVTLKFIAELPMASAAPLGDALRSLVDGETAPNASPFRLHAFPSLGEARIVTVELDDESRELARLARKVERLTQTFGIPCEERPFRPHVTIARLKRSYDSRRWLRPEPAATSGECQVIGVTLFRSDLDLTRATHVPLARFAFVRFGAEHDSES